MKVLRSDLLELPELVDAGVVDQDVETAERLLGLGEQAVDLLRLRHVGLDGDGSAALARDVGDDAIAALLAGGVVDDDGGARLGQMPGDSGPDPLGSPGDDATLLLSLLMSQSLRGLGMCRSGLGCWP
jgi:hypothetical protein